MESLPPPCSATSSSNSKSVIDSGERNWLDLPRDAILSIFRKLNTIETLVRAHNVCKTWRKISEDPFLYRTIDMRNLGEPDYTLDLKALCHRAVDYSCGHIIDIDIEYFGTDDLLHHLADSASHLRRLRLACCWGVSDEALCEVAEKFPHLEEIDISIGNLSDRSLGAIGRCCPQLKTCKFNTEVYRYPHDESNDEAFAIAKTMPGLRHLQLIGNKMTNDGLLAILDGCPLLESLDMRRCFNVNLVGSLGKRCQEQIKCLRLPCDATDDYPFEADCDDGSAGEDYPDGISDIDMLSDDDYEVYDYGYDEFSSEDEFSDDHPYNF
ncbi:putative F-box/LRR-repeat protein [Trifolium repens]|nr:putative F-box/LRR-repeat protein [Trifolium repens]